MNILSIDIGGTSVKCGLVTFEGEILTSSGFLTEMDELNTFEKRLNDHIRANYSKHPFVGIAISCTGVARQDLLSIGEGNAIYSTFGKNLAKNLQASKGVPVSVENDGNCSLLAEHWLGAGKGCRHLASLVIGTSIGGAIIINHQLYRGSQAMAGEFGYGLFRTSEETWELWADIGSTYRTTQLYSRPVDGLTLVSFSQQGDTLATNVLKEMAKKLAVMAYNIQHFLDPEKIIVGGGISESAIFMDLVRQELNLLCQSIPSTLRIPILESCHFGNQAHLIGATRHWMNVYVENEESLITP